MTFLSIFCALVLEQMQAAPFARVQAMFMAYADFLENHFNGGEHRHGKVAWMLGAAVPAGLVLILQLVLDRIHPVLWLVFAVALLFLMMGFRQFSHFFTDIQLALRMGSIEQARQLLSAWRGTNADRLGTSDVARLAIEQGILSSHRHVFGPLFWFMVAGPAGAVLYRMSGFLAQRWGDVAPTAMETGSFGQTARQAFQWLDWMPVRLTAITFAVVGDFEDAVYCWRSQAAQWPDAASGILLSSGAGALGVRLGLPLPEAGNLDVRPELGLGDEADVEHLQSATGLLWRALVLAILLLALLTVASWVGD